MRAFIALELPPDIRHALHQLQQALAISRADVKWVEEANLHLTMRFLGEITQEQRHHIEAVLRAIAGHTRRLCVQLGEVGAFPSVSSPRVMWVGFSQGAEAVTALAREVETGVVSCGVAPESRPFAPHVTLGRVRTPRHRAQLIERLRQIAWQPPASFCLDGVTLFQSTLLSSGPRYAALVRPAFTP